ncbi:MAG: AAA family ATPase [Egibacteraceae bacterium]
MAAHDSHTTLPTGIALVETLPGQGDDGFGHLFLPEGVAERLVNQAVFSLAHRRHLSAVRSGLHGLVLLEGPPGTGKTTAARALAHAAALRLADRGATTLVVIDPHALPSDLLGASQRNVANLLGESVPRLAAERPFTIVLVDEIEALATRRSAASLETNPADLHRATDAVLTGLDAVAAAHPSVLVVATTNFVATVDEALLSRADLVVEFAVPDAVAAEAILRDSLSELAGSWPALKALVAEPGLATVAERCRGLDGRRLRKLVLAAVTARSETVDDPGRLTLDDLLEAVRAVPR